MKLQVGMALKRILSLLWPYRGYQGPRLRPFPSGVKYAAAGAYPLRRATRLPL